MPSISRIACCSDCFASARSARWPVRKSWRLSVSSCSSIASTLTGPSRSSSWRSDSASARSASSSSSTACASASMSSSGRRHSVSSRSRIAARRPPSSVWRSSAWCNSSLCVCDWRRASSSACSAFVRCLVGRAHAVLGAHEPRFAVGERGLAGLEIELPRRHLLGERRIGLREIRQLGAQRFESRRRGLLLLRRDGVRDRSRPARAPAPALLRPARLVRASRASSCARSATVSCFACARQPIRRARPALRRSCDRLVVEPGELLGESDRGAS